MDMNQHPEPGGDDEFESLNRRIKYLENYDTLTGLPNRNLFIEKVNNIIRSSADNIKNNAVLAVDLDDFRKLNDTYGYITGDGLLKTAAEKLKSCLRENDFIGRTGNDDFFVFISGFDDLDDVNRIAERILTCFNDIWRVDSREFYITVSIGIAPFCDDTADAAEILRDASSALFAAKRMGKNRFLYHQSDMNVSLSRNSQIATCMRCAVNRDEIMIHYQPQVHVETGRITGVEALARWLHPVFGVIPPGNFIPVAEDSGLIIPIGNRVIELICAQNRKWEEMGFGRFHVAANVSAKQLQQKEFVRFIDTVLSKTGMDPLRLELEVTESALVSSMNSAAKLLRDLRSMGIKISLDDFGTGYSSLSYLRVLPVDKIKLDKSFVDDIGKNSKTEAIISAVIRMSEAMSLDMVAEGVETSEQAEFLKVNGCGHVQGFLYSRPLAEEQFAMLLSDQKVILEKDSWFYYQI